jgi:hypothetical protein
MSNETNTYDELLREQTEHGQDQADRYEPTHAEDLNDEDYDGHTQTIDENFDQDVESVDDEVEEIAEPTEASDDKLATKTEKAPAKPKRGDLPEGYVTPVGLAKLINENKLHRNKEGELTTCPPQVVYSHIKNAPKDHPFPLETVADSNGQSRQVVKIDAGLQWWREKNERTAQRKANAADKARKQAEAAQKAAEATASTSSAGNTTPDAVVEEAEDAVEAE